MIIFHFKERIIKKEELKKNLQYYQGQYRGLIIFNLCNNEFCIDINDVIATIKLDGTVNYPNQFLYPDSRFCYNEINFLTINMHKYFGLELENLKPNSRIMLLEYNKLQVGFIVDDVVEMLTIDNNLINNLDYNNEDGYSYLKGILRFNGRKLMVPDLDKIFTRLNKD